jgi:hypothetical protein
MSTPRTDAQLAGVGPFVTDSDNRAVSWTDYECLADHARQLERELASVKEEAARLRGIMASAIAESGGCDLPVVANMRDLLYSGIE